MSETADSKQSAEERLKELRSEARAANRTVLTLVLSLIVSWLAVIEPTYSEFQSVVEGYEESFLNPPGRAREVAMGFLTRRLSNERLLLQCQVETAALTKPANSEEVAFSVAQESDVILRQDGDKLESCNSGGETGIRPCTSDRALMKRCNRRVAWQFRDEPIVVKPSEFYLNASQSEILAWESAQRRVAEAAESRRRLQESASFEVLGTAVPVRKVLAVFAWSGLFVFALIYVVRQRHALGGEALRLSRSGLQSRDGLEPDENILNNAPAWLAPLETMVTGRARRESAARLKEIFGDSFSSGKTTAWFVGIVLTGAVLIQMRVAWIGFMLTDDYRAVVETSTLWRLPWRASAWASDMFLTSLLVSSAFLIWAWWGPLLTRRLPRIVKRPTAGAAPRLPIATRRGFLATAMVIGGAISLRSLIGWTPGEKMRSFAEERLLRSPFARYAVRKKLSFPTTLQEGFYATRYVQERRGNRRYRIHYVGTPDMVAPMAPPRAIRGVKSIDESKLAPIDILEEDKSLLLGVPDRARLLWSRVGLINRSTGPHAIEMAAIKALDTDRARAKKILRTAVEIDLLGREFGLGGGFNRDRISRRIYDFLATIYSMDADESELEQFVEFLASVPKWRSVDPGAAEQLPNWLRRQIAINERNQADLTARIRTWGDRSGRWREARRAEPLIVWSWSGSDGKPKSTTIARAKG